MTFGGYGTTFTFLYIRCLIMYFFALNTDRAKITLCAKGTGMAQWPPPKYASDH